MKYVVLLLLTVLMAIGCGGPRFAGSPASAIAADHMVMASILRNRAVALVGTTKSGYVEAYCSGVWVSQSEILTAAHCVSGEDSANYVVNSDVFSGDDPTPREKIQPHFAIVVKRDLDHDLAVLGAYTWPPSHDYAPIFNGEVSQGQLVQTMGQPIGLWFSYSSGEVAAIRVMPNALGFEMLLIQATAPISPGSSGGGLYDESGNVIGITHGSFSGAENINLFIHTKYIRGLFQN